MASSDNLASIEPWSVFRSLLSDSSFANQWMLSSSDSFYLESETMTRALSASMSPTTTTTIPTPPPTIDNTLNEILNQLPNPDTPPQGQQSSFSTGSGSVSGSDRETAPKRTIRNNIPMAPSSGKPTKRKSRASKKSPTTFITADPANFRQMVQQVTGVKFAASGGSVPVTQILKPEPQRIGMIGSGSGFGRLQGCLPTLDTSAFLLDHHQQQVAAASGGITTGNASGNGGGGGGLGFMAPPAVNANASGGATATAGVDFEGFASFPTLESWKVM